MSGGLYHCHKKMEVSLIFVAKELLQLSISSQKSKAVRKVLHHSVLRVTKLLFAFADLFG